MKNTVYILGFLILSFSCKTERKNNQFDQDSKETAYQGEVLQNIALASGKIIRFEDFPTKYVQPRNVDVWLPKDYSKNKKYAVLYMHDGQMLFDSTTTWNKQEWEVDEVASQLMEQGRTINFIVIAIHNISEIRWQDYYPQKTWNFIPKEDQEILLKEAKKTGNDLSFHADNYLKFIVEDVKPFIDKTYSVHTNRENTFIGGSSMGGLISMYAMFEYPEVFGGAACISTHWPGATPRDNNPMAKAFFEYMRSKPIDPKTHKFYFDYGTKTLDAHYPQYAGEVDAIFASKGFDDTNFKNLKFEGTAHNEISWAKRLDVPLTFLLGNND